MPKSVDRLTVVVVGCVSGSVTHDNAVGDGLRLSPNPSCIESASRFINRLTVWEYLKSLVRGELETFQKVLEHHPLAYFETVS